MKLLLDLFFILHFTYLGVHMHPTHPPAYWPGAEVCFMPYYAFLFHAWKNGVIKMLFDSVAMPSCSHICRSSNDYDYGSKKETIPGPPRMSLLH